MTKYRTSCKKAEKFQTLYELALKRMKLGWINCTKYNNTLDLSVQKQMSYAAILKLSADA